MLILFTGVYCYFYGQEFFIFIVYSMTFHGGHIIPILCSNIIEIISGLEIICGPIWGSIIAVGIYGGLYRSKLFKGWILEENNKTCSSEGRRTLPSWWLSLQTALAKPITLTVDARSYTDNSNYYIACHLGEQIFLPFVSLISCSRCLM